MVTHEPDMAAYAKRIVRFVDGKVESDQRHAPSSDAGAATAMGEGAA
jgi:putative ABC transport system ATP-binding protein